MRATARCSPGIWSGGWDSKSAEVSVLGEGLHEIAGEVAIAGGEFPRLPIETGDRRGVVAADFAERHGPVAKAPFFDWIIGDDDQAGMARIMVDLAQQAAD